MEYKAFFKEMLSSYLSSKLSRSEVAENVAYLLPIDSNFVEDKVLMNNCEWALRHINEAEVYSTDGELSYYLSCLMGECIYDEGERNKRI
jgi:hypothetical protein